MEIEFHQLEKKYAGLRIADASRLARLVASLCTHGQQQPVLVVRASGNDGAVPRYVLIDGYARVAALGELKRDSVAATVLDLAEADALVLAFRLDRRGAGPGLESGKSTFIFHIPDLAPFPRSRRSWGAMPSSRSRSAADPRSSV